MPHPHTRTEILSGVEGLARLRAARVLVARLGGVGGHAAEALGRAGVGRLTLWTTMSFLRPISTGNWWRCIPQAAQGGGDGQARLRDIDPAIELTLISEFLQPAAADRLIAATRYDYVADCIDSIVCKAALVTQPVTGRATTVISALGCG